MARRRDQLPPPDPPKFRLSDWYAPELDPLPPPYVPYATREDRWVYHFVRAIRRHQAARGHGAARTDRDEE